MRKPEGVKVDGDFAIFTILYIENQVLLTQEEAQFQKEVFNVNKSVKLHNIKR